MKFEAVVSAGAAALPDVTAALNGPRPDLAVAALGRMKLKQAAVALAPLSGSDDGELRASVAWALGECASPEAALVLSKLAADPYPPARVSAIVALARLGPPDLEARLRSALADPDERVRRAAVQALQSTGNKRLVSLLLPMLLYKIEHVPDPNDKTGKKIIDQIDWNEPSPAVRLAAIEAAQGRSNPSMLFPPSSMRWNGPRAFTAWRSSRRSKASAPPPPRSAWAESSRSLMTRIRSARRCRC